MNYRKNITASEVERLQRDWERRLEDAIVRTALGPLIKRLEKIVEKVKKRE